MLNFITKAVSVVFGSKSEKDLKEVFPFVSLVNEEFESLSSISDDDLRALTSSHKEVISNSLEKFGIERERLRNAAVDDTLSIAEQQSLFEKLDSLEEEENARLEDILMELLPKAFATVKETARRYKENGQLVVSATPMDIEIASVKNNVIIEGDRAIWKNKWEAAGNEIVWDMLHYDVQIIGGVVLHQGKISEMATGEGKTLVATLPAYLNALAGKGVHIVTVNNYLAKRDAEWMAPLMEFHGLTVACIDNFEPHSEERKAAYKADITYGTNNEFGFDYLRDNMVKEEGDLVQLRHHFAMIDEVDSVLIDDARTPLIISGPVNSNDQQEYEMLKPRISRLLDAQKRLVLECLNEAKRAVKSGDENAAGLPLFRAHRGLPKYKPLIKFIGEPGVKAILQKTENYYLQDNSREMPKADEPLLFTIDERNNSIDLTEKGIETLTKDGEDPTFFVLPDIAIDLDVIEKDSSISDQEKLEKKESLMEEYKIKSQRIHSATQLLKAFTLFEKDIDYVVLDSKVKIVDEQTGRIMEGRRYSDGLHQALEAKEGVKIEAPSQTYATITLQNYFRMYHKLSGMTGTAETEAGEFWEIYKLDVVVIPTNRPIQRVDSEDKVYRTIREKLNAVSTEIQNLVEQGRPVLVGTTSVENSEILSRMLKLRKIEHQVLNAKHHAREADIVASAGQPGAVTIATNMAGRGTDIKLPAEAKKSGGLAIIGTERHESRRIDRQLRGRAGRQGDPGSSQFFVSLEDNLMRLFGSEKIAKVMDRIGLEEGEVIQHSMITKSIERAQTKVEENNFSIRKRLLEYDDVMNFQREVIYKRRKSALQGDRIKLDVLSLFYDVSLKLVENQHESFSGFKLDTLQYLGVESPLEEEEWNSRKNAKDNASKLFKTAFEKYQANCKSISEKTFPLIEKIYLEQGDRYENIAVPFSDGKKTLPVLLNLKKAHESSNKLLIKTLEQAIVLSLIDFSWKDHLREMDNLKQEVQNAVFEQKDPLLIYKFEAFELFKSFLAHLSDEIVSFLSSVEIEKGSESVDASVSNSPTGDDASKVVENKSDYRFLPSSIDRRGGESQPEYHSDTQGRQSGNRDAKPALKPRESEKSYGRNDRVDVKYANGEVKKGVKFKSVEQDLNNNKCIVI